MSRNRGCGQERDIFGRFDGNTIITMGTIMLSIVILEVTIMVNFMVINDARNYNLILGRPWLHIMIAIVLTLHQTLKYPVRRNKRELWCAING